jgi:hypothetical protein
MPDGRYEVPAAVVAHFLDLVEEHLGVGNWLLAEHAAQQVLAIGVQLGGNCPAG